MRMVYVSYTHLVLHPLKVVLTNWDADKTLTLTVENHTKHPEMGSHTVTFGKELYIEPVSYTHLLLPMNCAVNASSAHF